jgi:hypothetical protein
MTSLETILAVHSGALGDVILFARLLSRLGGEVTLVAGGEKAALLAGMGVVRRAIGFESLPMQEVFADKPLSECRLPALLGEHGRLVSCFAAGDRKAELRLAAMCGAGSAAFLPICPPEDFDGHLLRLWCDLLGLARAAEARPWPVPEPWRRDAGRVLAEAGAAPGAPYVVIHPGSGSAKKCWPLPRFVELAGRLREKDSRQVIFALGPAEVDRWPAGEIESLRHAFPTLLAPSLAVLAGTLAEADGYAGNDSGVSHLAAAVGARTVALFGPSRAEHFAPVGESVTVIARDNIEEIDVGQVLDVISPRR